MAYQRQRRCCSFKCILNIGGLTLLLCWGAFLMLLTIRKRYSFENMKDERHLEDEKKRIKENEEVLDLSSSPQHFHGHLQPLDSLGKPMVDPISIQVPLDRDVPDFRHESCKSMVFPPLTLLPKLSVIIIFNNEPKFNLLRTIHSVLNRTPHQILSEILLVDDHSDHPYIREDGENFLSRYIKELPKVRLIRNPERTGIVGARMLGIKTVKSDIFAILDSHVEVGHGWAEVLVARIAEDRRRIVMPLIDGIQIGNYEPTIGGIGCVLGILWRMVEHSFPPDLFANSKRSHLPPTEYITSPTMAGGIFAAHKDFFLEMGGYDEGITFWGVENVELSFRWWQCGGQIECSECSRVFHLFGGYRGYSAMPGSSTTRNKLRVMAVWMDEFADFSWQMMGSPEMNPGNLTIQKALRQRLNCKPFSWFLREVWPESDIQQISDVPYLGEIKLAKHENLCLTNLQPSLVKCDAGRSFVYFRQPGRITPKQNEETCLTSTGETLSFETCHEARPSSQRFAAVDVPLSEEEEERKEEGWSSPLHLQKEGKCLTASGDSPASKVTLQPCTSGNSLQIWKWRMYQPSATHPWDETTAVNAGHLRGGVHDNTS